MLVFKGFFKGTFLITYTEQQHKEIKACLNIQKAQEGTMADQVYEPITHAQKPNKNEYLTECDRIYENWSKSHKN